MAMAVPLGLLDSIDHIRYGLDILLLIFWNLLNTLVETNVFPVGQSARLL